MTTGPRRLHNEDWGFETNCFVCEPRNDRGLRLPFWCDDEAGVVSTEFELDAGYSGAPNFVHGGVTLAVLDEAQAWACIAIGHQWALTTETTTRFLRPVRIGHRYRVEARVVDHTDSIMRTTGVVTDEAGKVRAESTAAFTTIGEAYARRAIGDVTADLDPTYLSGG